MKNAPLPPKPPARIGRAGAFRLAHLFRKDLLSALPAKLYRAWMAEMKSLRFRSYMVNDPELIRRVLKERPDDFPKSERVGAGLRPLLGNSVFLTNGEIWKAQRRIIDPAFEGGRLREIFPAIWDASEAASRRLSGLSLTGPIDIEPHTSHAAADVIFRTLFSLPIEHALAEDVFKAFKAHQRSQPIVNLAAFVPLPRWMPHFFSKKALTTAKHIRGLITQLVEMRAAQIAAGNAPEDLATKIMTTPDPQTGALFSAEEMVDQVAIFFLAGHETSASALAWALYLMAENPDWQEKAALEAQAMRPEFSNLSKLRLNRDIFREALRLYPPVPMMVRETTVQENFRGRDVRVGAQVVLSPWHLQRHERIWPEPDAFNPARWQDESQKQAQRDAYMPFSSGPRVCVGAGFAMMEGTLLLAMLLRDYRFEIVEGERPVPVAYLTVRAKDGIWLKITPRAAGAENLPEHKAG